MISNSRAKGDFDLIVFQDMCRVRDWGLNYFDIVIDIGANIGVFSIMMRMLHPNARIIAVEPSDRSLDILKSNLDHMDIDIDTRGLGDGSVMHLQYGRKKSPMGDWFSPHKKHKYSHSVKTVPFWKLFKDHNGNLDKKFFVKIDCEGGEQYLIGDTKSEDILVKAHQVFLEIHFKAKKNPWHSEGMIEFKAYEEWVNDVFSKTHDIELFHFKIDRGFGHYCIRKKKG
jgi:FkbM family methyltransferase